MRLLNREEMIEMVDYIVDDRGSIRMFCVPYRCLPYVLIMASMRTACAEYSILQRPYLPSMKTISAA